MDNDTTPLGVSHSYWKADRSVIVQELPTLEPH
jgi:hypothetical protein